MADVEAPLSVCAFSSPHPQSKDISSSNQDVICFSAPSKQQAICCYHTFEIQNLDSTSWITTVINKRASHLQYHEPQQKYSFTTTRFTISPQVHRSTYPQKRTLNATISKRKNNSKQSKIAPHQPQLICTQYKST